MRTDAPKSGFSLIELLVVIAIIAILAGLLLPTLTKVRERSRRAACLSNQRQFLMGLHLYAQDNRDFLPSSGTDAPDQTDIHTAIISKHSRSNLLRYVSAINVMDCPNLYGAFQKRIYWREHPGYGFAIGYHYLGGHANTPWKAAPRTTNTWVAPRKTTEDPSLTLLADLNIYTYSFQRILAPHCSSGSVLHADRYFASNPKAFIQTPREVGAEGGNIGIMDGSASWKPFPKMRLYRSSHLWDDSGSFGFW